MIPLPNNVSPFISKIGRVVSPWLQYLQQFTQAPPNVTKLGGPATFVYTAKEPGTIMIDGGVTSVSLTRGGITIKLGNPSVIPVAIADTVNINSALGSVYFVPSYGQNTNV